MYLKGLFKKLQLIATANGYPSLNSFLYTYLVPLTVTVIFAAVGMLIFVPQITKIILVVAGFGLLAIWMYPISTIEEKKRDINNNIHLFITYAGTISTMQVSREVLFERISEKKVFGEISHIAQQILYLSKEWNLGFSKTCRKVSRVLPSYILADFFDRFAVMMDFGEDLESFLLEEQKSVLDDYSTEYKKSLENIKTLQEVYISLTMAIAFGISIGLLLPMLSGISITVVILVAVLATVFIDSFMIVIIKAVIPEDPLFHSLEKKSVPIQQLQIFTIVLGGISFVLFLALWLIFNLNFMFSLAIGMTPMFLVGLRAKLEEEYVFRRDATFPAFVRTLGSATQVRGGAFTLSVGSLLIHDFALLNDMVVNLYKRLAVGSDKNKSWFFFAVESGSNLIYHYSRIFAQSVFLGGNAKKIGEIISRNFQRMIALRKLKLQQASGLRGAAYGSLIGLATTTFVSIEIVDLLSTIFGDTSMESSDFSVASILGSGDLTIDFVQVSIAIAVMILLHSILTSFLMKIVDGGTYYAVFFDIVLMLWIGAILSWLIPGAVSSILPDMSSSLTSTIS